MKNTLQQHKRPLSFDDQCELLALQSALIGYIPLVRGENQQKINSLSIGLALKPIISTSQTISVIHPPRFVDIQSVMGCNNLFIITLLLTPPHYKGARKLYIN